MTSLALADLLVLSQQQLMEAADAQSNRIFPGMPDLSEWTTKQSKNDVAEFDLIEHPEYLEDEFHGHDTGKFIPAHKSYSAFDHVFEHD